jgi:hypothetical protein
MGGKNMVEDAAALRRCVNVFVEHAENLRADELQPQFR